MSGSEVPRGAPRVGQRTAAEARTLHSSRSPCEISPMKALLLVLCAAAVGCGPAQASTPPSVGVSPSPSTHASEAEPLAAGPIHPRELLDEASDDWLGREMVVDIFEPLYDADHHSAAVDGEFVVEVSDVGTATLTLSPARSADESRGGALAVLPAQLAPPVRVRGVFVRDTHREAQSGRRWRVLIVQELSPLEFPEASTVPSAETILADPVEWDGRYVTVEDIWHTGFEASYLGASHRVWLDFYPHTVVRCESLDSPRQRQVRVTGFVHTGARGYGHLSHAPALLVATEVTFVDPARPGCE